MRRSRIPGISSLLLALAIFCPHLALANGGTFATSSVYSTGNLQPQRKPKVDLSAESLHVVLNGEWADVEVTYTLRNRGGANSMTYGFPVDADSAAWLRPLEQNIESFEMFDGNRRLEITKVIKEPDSNAIAPLTEEAYPTTVRDWYFATLKFERGETKTLRVNYNVKTFGTTSGTSKSFRWVQSPRRFVYTFKPAKTWGNGRVGHLDIVVDSTRLKEAHIPVNSIAPPGSTDENGLLHWALENVDLSKLPDLVVKYDNGLRQSHEIATKYRLDPKLIESIRASSTHPPSSKAHYDVRNLLDGRLDTAWLTESNARGQWIEVTFKHPVWLSGIGILNGYLKSPRSLSENGQVTKAGIHVFAAKGDDFRDSVSVAKSQFDPNLQTLPGAFVQWVMDIGEGNLLAKRFRLTIEKAERGAQYSETAISELYIYGSEQDPTRPH